MPGERISKSVYSDIYLYGFGNGFGNLFTLAKKCFNQRIFRFLEFLQRTFHVYFTFGKHNYAIGCGACTLNVVRNNDGRCFIYFLNAVNL